MRSVEGLWHGTRPLDRAARLALGPAEGLYRGITALRGAVYDTGLLTAHRSPVAVVSVGNLTVGGTGKTPVSAWIAATLASRGMRPAIVLRGYGGDEPMVHARLNPGVPVIVNAARLDGIREAVAAGANVAVLDDGFQHRRAARDLDVVLVSADNWTGSQRLLPAGPWREPLSAIKRASIVIITRKVASDAECEAVGAAIRSVAPGVPQARIRLTPSHLVSAVDEDTVLPLARLKRARVLAIAAVADPEAFFSQLELAGAAVSRLAFRDHHAFTEGEIDQIATDSSNADFVICTLKDAVKLAPLWPPGATPLWYVSQSLQVESGSRGIDELLRLLHQPLHP